MYGVTQLMRDCTDKVKVRDYVKEKIGEEYLKSVLQIIPNESHETMNCHCEQVNDNSGLARQSTDESQDILDCRADIKMSLSARLRFPKFQFRENRVLAEYNDKELDDVSTYFDKINFDKLPKAFVIKTNHGCKWQYIIKNKNEFLQNKRLFEVVKQNITGWLEQDYSFWNGFEMQYKGIISKILIEQLMIGEEMQVYCVKGQPKYLIRIFNNNTIAIFDENLNITNDIFGFKEQKINTKANELIKQTFVLSTQLAKNFNFVRVDWITYQNKLYFEELTFTPYSGFNCFKNNLNVNELLNIER